MFSPGSGSRRGSKCGSMRIRIHSPVSPPRYLLNNSNVYHQKMKNGDRRCDWQVEVKPYVLDDQLCDECQGARCGGKFAPFFCANVTCLQVCPLHFCSQSTGAYKDLLLYLHSNNSAICRHSDRTVGIPRTEMIRTRYGRSSDGD